MIVLHKEQEQPLKNWLQAMYKQSAFYQIRVKIAFILQCDLKCIRHSKAVLLSKMKKMVQVHCGQRKITQIKKKKYFTMASWEYILVVQIHLIL